MPTNKTNAIRARLVSLGIDPEKFDVKAHIDRTLTPRENIMNIRAMTGTGPRKDYKGHPLLSTHHEPGESLHLDAMRHAKLPGKRTTRWGTVYYESRRNRTDRKGSKI